MTKNSKAAARTCVICGQEFTPAPKSAAKTCSRDCWIELVRRNSLNQPHRPRKVRVFTCAFSLLPLPGFTLPNFHSRRLEDIRHADPMPLLSPTFAGKSLPKFPRVTFLQGVAENLSAPTDFLLAFPFSPLYSTSHRTSFRKTLVKEGTADEK